MKKHDLETVDYRDVIIKYSFESSLGAMENNRYQQRITGDIIQIDDYDNEVGSIGKLSADKLLMDISCDNGWGLFPVCDIEQYLMDIGEVVYNFKEQDYNEVLNTAFNDLLIERTILILNFISFLPNYEPADLEK